MTIGSLKERNHSQKIHIVIDTSHSNWVLGGLFRELASTSPSYFDQTLISISAPRSLSTLLSWLKTCWKIHRIELLMFSSLTPLENYIKFPLKRKSQSIFLWFTHKEGEFNKREINALERATHIFMHSANDVERISRGTSTRCTVLTGAVNPIRFTPPSEFGEDIAWIGSPSPRKRPELLLEVARKLPNSRFRLIGPNWRKSAYWRSVSESANIDYVELDGAITSRDLDGCSILLTTSEVEGGPMPLLEGVASGLFPITTNVGFAKDVLTMSDIPEEFVVQPNSDAFVTAIIKAREMISSGFTPNREKILNLTFERMAKIVHSKLFRI